MINTVSKNIRLILLVCIFFISGTSAWSQRYYSPNVTIGGKAGVTMSSMGFSPSVRQSMEQGMMMGLTFRYTEEKTFGLIAELNFMQQGWKEDFEELPLSYSRKLTYIQIPILTHIYFGSNKFKGFVNLGPSVSYMISESTNANFDYEHTSSVPDFPRNRMTEQLYTPVANKMDYGISGGAGIELFINKHNSIVIEGRYYYGLGNIFPSSKADTFAASRNSCIQITIGYNFRVK
ncbi:MAG: PorT family protein [Muribaculaceae bacterium]|nr:PorT family protein [Muribaculaceae bacterium]